MPALLKRTEVLGIDFIKLKALGSTRKFAARTVDDTLHHSILFLDYRFGRRSNRCGGTILGNRIDTRSNGLLVNKRSHAVMNQDNRVLVRYAKPIKFGKTHKDGILTSLAARNDRQNLRVMSILDYFAHVVYTRSNTHDNNARHHRVLFKMVDGMSNNGLSAQFQKLLGDFCSAHTRSNAAGKNNHKHIFRCAHNYLRINNLARLLTNHEVADRRMN